jgi:SAM-dependent methyltransferase
MQWFEDERFWTELYPYMFDEKRLGQAEEQVEQLITLAGVAGGSVLDLCCGPGRHSAALARKGFAVTAVDRSPFLLSKARERAAGLPIEFVEADMREFVRPAAFDLVVNLFTSFGYLDTREQDLGVLQNIRASLKSGGRLVIDIFGKEQMATPGSARTHWNEHADARLRSRTPRSRKTGREPVSSGSAFKANALNDTCSSTISTRAWN